MRNNILNDKILALREKKLTYKEIGEFLGVTKQAIHYRLKSIGEDGLLKKQCPYCKKLKANCHKHHGWGRICDSCYSKKKRTNKYEWSCDFEKCIDCGTTTKKHRCFGRCTSCSSLHRYHNDPTYRKKKLIETLEYFRKNRKRRIAEMRIYNLKNKKTI